MLVNYETLRAAESQAVKRMMDINEGPEESHITADKLLVAFLRGIGCEDLAIAYEDCEKRNGFWYA